MEQVLKYEITAAGWLQVHSPAFAELVRNELARYRDERLREKFGISLVAWVVTGHDMNKPPQAANEMLALLTFVNSHTAQVQEVVNSVLATLAAHDTAGHA